MYNPIVSFTVVPNFAEGHFIQWKLDPIFQDAELSQYSVQASGTPDFSEIIYTLPAADTYFLRDTSNFKQSWADDMWYRLKLVTPDGNIHYSKEVIFGGTMPMRRQYAIAAEIQRKEILRMSRFTGGQCWLLKRKSFGTPQKNMVDPVSGIALADNTTDYGTGLEGGYFTPLKVVVSFEDVSQDRKMDQSGMGVTEILTAKIRMIGYPIVEINDVVVDGKNDKRYIIKDIQQTPFPATEIVLVQQLTGILVPNTDPIYKIVIDTKA